MARPDPPAPEDSRLAAAQAAMWGALSRLRRARIVHPDGIACRGTFTARPAGEPIGTPLFDAPATHPAIARFSRSLGAPPPVPDLLGMTVRIENAHGPGEHQDFPMITSAEGPVLHHLLLPGVAGFFGQPYSTSLPYSIGDRTWVVGATAHAPPAPRGARGRLAEVEDARAAGTLRFTLWAATLRGERRPVGELHLTERLPPQQSEALTFNPWNSGGGIRPTGPFMGARLSAYRGSQAGRRRARS